MVNASIFFDFFDTFMVRIIEVKYFVLKPCLFYKKIIKIIFLYFFKATKKAVIKPLLPHIKFEPKYQEHLQVLQT